ncbi:Alcohol dehydrogenase superfamily zinc-containing [Macrophomina phaseolina MS6]|uniref:Alcohol dehydrogenase superfamily zinc-containing n=1 Tax=Macrophomina phaseolina (strain MS6) TaxID=1126212 RepID=K2RAX7_MACPH|nr:Alcohol dehydrogenase superfamily zinc-containing [Macrophomina phaseolina MS6]
MSTQSALLVTAVGAPITSASDWPIPEPGPDQIQIRVTVTALNPHDQRSRDMGLFVNDNLPAILGNDVAGVVTAVGPHVTKFKPGDRIFTYGAMTADHAQKGLQQYALADEDFASLVPEGFSDHDIATLPVNISAGVVALFDESGLGIPAPWTEEARTFDYAGTQVLIVGGGSNCGRFGVQLATLAGIGKIVVVGGNEEELKRFGATHVLNRHGGHDLVLQRIRDVVGDDLLYCYDAVNPPDAQLLGINALSHTKKGKLARLLSFGQPGGSHVPDKKVGFEVKNVLGVPQLWPQTAKPFFERVAEYLSLGKIVPLKYDVAAGLDADKVNDVLDRYRDGKPVVQTHLRISG